MKIFYLICIAFCIHSIKILMDERYDVTYLIQNKTAKLEYLICIPLKNELFKNETIIDLTEIKDKLYNYFNSKLIENLNKLKSNILELIKSKSYLILRDQLCLVLSNRSEFQNFTSFYKNPKYFIFKRDNYYFFSLKILSFPTHQFIIKNLPYPYSNCRKNYSRYECINNCVRNQYRLSKYFYNSNESGIIYLNYKNNQTIINNENRCLNKCKIDHCKITYIVNNFPDKLTKIDGKMVIYKSYSLINNFDYFVQFIGLGFLFLGTNLYEIIVKLIKFIAIKKLKSYYLILKLSFLIALICCFLIINIKLTINYIDKNIKPIFKETTLSLLIPEKLQLIICVPIIKAKNQDFILGPNLFERTLLQLELDSNQLFNQTINEIYLQFQDKKLNTNWYLTQKIIFEGVRRCFQLYVYPFEPKYQSLLSFSKLTIHFKHRQFKLYLLPYEDRLNSHSFEYSGVFGFVKREESKLGKLRKCINYDPIKLNCNSRFDCVQRCIHRKVIEKNLNITSNLVIHKDFFNEFEWARSYLVNIETEKIRKLKEICESNYAFDPCYKESYEKNLINNQTGDNRISLDLYYDKIIVIEEETSIYKLLLDMINIESILFGLNIFKLISIFYLNFKLKRNLIRLFIIYTFCYFGFIIHSYFIFKEILFKNLVCSQFYEKSKSIDLSELIFCVNFNKNLIDENHKLTYEYLEKITDKINIKSIFEEIEYLNSNNEWSNYFNNQSFNHNLHIDTFYFFDKKCFLICTVNLIYKQTQFHFSDNKNVLQIVFNKSYGNNSNFIYFLTRTKNTFQFSKTLNLKFRFKSLINIRQESFFIDYNDKFNLIKNPLTLFYKDNNINDVNKYIYKLINQFKKGFKLKTLILPLEREKSNLINDNLLIDDLLFEQYYNQIQNITDSKYPSNSNFKRNFHINMIEFKNQDKEINFKFGLRFFKKIIQITNEHNYGKLILNLLNVFTFWFDQKILDMHIHLYKLKFIFLFIYKLLIKIELLLSNYIKLSLTKTYYNYISRNLCHLHTLYKRK